ncbi:MAG: hypothetical protein OIN90_04350 [Candidatus Methanoperedens sp.]|nr:hypothetical protein [Candidatus Methanoperedens sp.]
MAEYVYGSGVPYGQYLQDNAYVRDITGHIKKNGEATINQISAQTIELIASNECLSQKFGAGFDSVNGTLISGFDSINNELNNVEASIESLHSDFNYNMGLVLAQLQIQNQLTFGILEKLDAIHKTLANPELTKAREFYNRGCERLSKGLLDKALEVFLKAEEIDDTDFFTEYHIGKLYLFGVNGDINIICPEKAEHHLRNAARYGIAEMSALPEFYRLSGDALLNASIACYVQANEKQINGNTADAKNSLLKAFQLAQQARDIYPFLSQARYHLAKYAALLGDVKTSLENIEGALKIDIHYCLKVEFDRDFDKIRPQIFDLFENMRTQRSEMALKIYNEYSQKYLIDNVFFSQQICDEDIDTRKKIESILADIKTEIDRNTLIDINEALKDLDTIKSFFNINKKNYRIISRQELDKQKKKKAVIMEQKNQLKKLYENEARKEENSQKTISEHHIQEERKSNGHCSVCCKKLSFFEKLLGKTTCSNHSS